MVSAPPVATCCVVATSARNLPALPVHRNLEALHASLPLDRREPPGLLALDVSRRAIGLAGADPTWRLATPLGTIRRRNLADDLAALERTIRERDARVLIVGWPLNMDGTEGPRCHAVLAFARDLDRALRLPILLWDERLTTFAAEDLAEQAASKGRKRDLDALAAATILQDFLEAWRRACAPSHPRA
jgi:putative Holliday junction resolvase